MKTLKNLLPYLFLALTLTFLVGCGSGGPGPGGDPDAYFDTDHDPVGDADGGVVCENGMCCNSDHTACWPDGDAGGDPDAGSTDGGDVTTGCNFDSDCDYTERCDQSTNLCYPACFEQANCLNDQFCDMSDNRCFDQVLIQPFHWMTERQWRVIDGPESIGDDFALVLNSWDEHQQRVVGYGLPPWEPPNHIELWYDDDNLMFYGVGVDGSAETRNFNYDEGTQTMSYTEYYLDSGNSYDWVLQRL